MCEDRTNTVQGPDPNKTNTWGSASSCVTCGTIVSTHAHVCGQCYRIHPTITNLKKCIRCQNFVLPDAEICEHCNKKTDIPDLKMPQHETGMACVGVIGFLWTCVAIWSWLIKVAAGALIFAIVISLWRGNRVNKEAPITKTHFFQSIGHIAMFAIYIAGGCLITAILMDKFF